MPNFSIETPTVTAECPRCGQFASVPDWDTADWENGHTGYCSGCDRNVNWTPWRGPVMPV